MAPRNFIHCHPESWDDDLSTLNKTKLFLLSNIGPTVFVLKADDMTNKTFKVYIGENQRCSCGGGEGRGKLCIHLLYVMIKVLKVDPKNPLSWQLSLTDIEIDKILSNAHRCRRVGPYASDSSTTKKYHSFLKKGQGKNMSLLKKSTSDDESNNDDSNINCNEEVVVIEKAARSLENDPLCSICQEEMLESDILENKLCHCVAGCGSNFHTKCFKMYATYTKSENKKSVIVCPMCRTNWKESSTNATVDCAHESITMEKLMKDSGSKNVAALLPTVKCRECKIAIHTTFYRCVRCVTPYDLCRRCFHTVSGRTSAITSVSKPSSHECNSLGVPLSFVKCEISQYPAKWTAAIIPMQKRKNRMLRNERLSEVQQRDLNDSDYSFLLSLDGNSAAPPKLQSHLLQALESINTNGYLKLLEDSNDHTCALCLHSLSIEANLKRLTCPKNHIVHESCALNMFIEAESTIASCSTSACYYCTVCGKDALLFPALRRELKRGSKKSLIKCARDSSGKESLPKRNKFKDKRKDSSSKYSNNIGLKSLENVFDELIIGRTVKPGTKKEFRRFSNK